ncbi:MAG: hypothetical protein BIFFINMI_02828 [Phycisphaerae bacterium]|nr:hypothetical protein [Phycisphaerae bacterium]
MRAAISGAKSPQAAVSKGSLSPSFQRLIELMQRIGFGQILGLAVRNGEPDLVRGVRVVRTVKLAVDGEPQPQRGHNFAVRGEVVRLIQFLNQMGNGTVRRIEVRHGLPILLDIDETFQA